MSQQLQIDDRGFRNMMQVLQKKTGASYRDVIRAVTADVLSGAARKTRSADAAKIRESVMKMFRAPMKLPNGDRVGITKEGKVWFCASGWDPQKNWVLVSSNGELEMPGDRVFRTKGGSRTSRVKLSPTLQGRISAAIRQAEQIRNRELRYRLSVVALGRASWLEMAKQLKLTLAGGAKIQEAQRAKVPAKAAASVSAIEKGAGDQFAIELSNKMQAALNKHARGTAALRHSINGESRKFKKNIKKDLGKYVQRFAKRHGFDVTGAAA